MKLGRPVLGGGVLTALLPLPQWCQLPEAAAEPGAGERLLPAAGRADGAQAAAALPPARRPHLRQRGPGVCECPRLTALHTHTHTHLVI